MRGPRLSLSLGTPRRSGRPGGPSGGAPPGLCCSLARGPGAGAPVSPRPGGLLRAAWGRAPPRRRRGPVPRGGPLRAVLVPVGEAPSDGVDLLPGGGPCAYSVRSGSAKKGGGRGGGGNKRIVRGLASVYSCGLSSHDALLARVRVRMCMCTRVSGAAPFVRSRPPYPAQGPAPGTLRWPGGQGFPRVLKRHAIRSCNHPAFPETLWQGKFSSWVDLLPGGGPCAYSVRSGSAKKGGGRGGGGNKRIVRGLNTYP